MGYFWSLVVNGENICHWAKCFICFGICDFLFVFFQLPSDIRGVTIMATGHGLSLIEVATFYNIDNDDQKPAFYLKVTIPEETINEYKVMICTRYVLVILLYNPVKAYKFISMGDDHFGMEAFIP